MKPFTLQLTGRIQSEVEAADCGIRVDDDPNEFLDIRSEVNIVDVQVSGTVTINATVSVGDVEVDAEDMADFDADVRLQEEVSLYGGIDVSGAEFYVIESPTGFDDLASDIGQYEALQAYASLARHGYDVI